MARLVMTKTTLSEDDPFGPPIRLGRRSGRVIEVAAAPRTSGGSPTSSAPGYRPSQKAASGGSSGGGRASITTANRIRAARRVPEAVVKIASYGGGRSSTFDLLDYIGREGALPLETDSGESLEGRDAYRDLAQEWARADQKEGLKRKTMHMLVSGPKGEDPEKILEAAKLYGQKVFGEKFPYVMVLHNDKDHPHVHFLVRLKGRDEERFRIEQGGFQTIREAFAESCREVGIEMNATPREVRGAARSESMKLRKMQENGRKPKIHERAEGFVRDEKKASPQSRNIPREKRLAKLKTEAAAHRKIARQFDTSSRFASPTEREELKHAAKELEALAAWLDAGGAQTRPDRVRGIAHGGAWKAPKRPPGALQMPPGEIARAEAEGRKRAARTVETLPVAPERERAEQASADLQKPLAKATPKAPASKPRLPEKPKEAKAQEIEAPRPNDAKAEGIEKARKMLEASKARKQREKDREWDRDR